MQFFLFLTLTALVASKPFSDDRSLRAAQGCCEDRCYWALENAEHKGNHVKKHCSSYLAVTVTPCVSTTTTTSTHHATATVTSSCGEEKVTRTKREELLERDLPQKLKENCKPSKCPSYGSPHGLPWYASECRPDDFSKACKCLGIRGQTTTLPASTTTKTKSVCGGTKTVTITNCPTRTTKVQSSSTTSRATTTTVPHTSSSTTTSVPTTSSSTTSTSSSTTTTTSSSMTTAMTTTTTAALSPTTSSSSSTTAIPSCGDYNSPAVSAVGLSAPAENFQTYIGFKLSGSSTDLLDDEDFQGCARAVALFNGPGFYFDGNCYVYNIGAMVGSLVADPGATAGIPGTCSSTITAMTTTFSTTTTTSSSVTTTTSSTTTAAAAAA